MFAPDWYREWRHEAVHQLETKNARLEADYQLSRWPRFDYDVEAQTLTFSENGVPRVIATIQVVGSTSAKADNWMWAWANGHLPDECALDAERVRTFGEQERISELTNALVPNDAGDLNGLGWTMSAVLVRVVDAIGAYRPPRSEGGGLYLAYKTMSWTG